MRKYRERLPGGALVLAGTGVLAVVTRLPFVGAGLGPDEGGAAYVARQWSHGARLYHDVWIDRPQGLLSLYRGIEAIGANAWTIRLAAMLFGVAITWLMFALGSMIGDFATGVAAGVLYAVVGAGPHIEGFTMNGELAAALPSTAAVAVAVAWWRGGRGLRWLFAAGVLGGVAILMKQGGFDGLVAAGVLALAVPHSPSGRVRAAAAVAAGALIPITVAALHALSVGFNTYWSDIVSFRANAQFHDGSRSHFFDASLPKARADLLALGLLALVGIAVVARRRTVRVLLGAWLVAALLAFDIGGLFWPHYYVQLVPPLALLAALGATAFRSRVLAAALCCAAVVPVVVTLVGLEADSAAARAAAIPYERDYDVDRRVAEFMRANTTPAAPVYALDSRADVYFLADRRTRYPYIFHHSPILTRSGIDYLRLMLTGPRRPRVVAVYRDPNHFDRSGTLAFLLNRGYRVIWRPAPGVRVLVRRPGWFGHRPHVRHPTGRHLTR
ncbi:MAG: hypothetical protein ACJ760_02235 [Thermoleophilaceae bacterium]